MQKNEHIFRENCDNVGLPYFEGFTNAVSRLLQKFNIAVYTYPYKTIRDTSPQLKDSLDLIYKSVAICKIYCKECSSVYSILLKRVDVLILANLNINVIKNLSIWLN